MDKLLSQEEVDALLQGVSHGEIETESQQEEVGDGVVSGFDFTNQDRIIRGRMPTMEIINERFARDATASFFRYIGRMVDVVVESFELIKFGELIKKLPVPSSLNLFRADPFRGSSMFFFDAKLIYLIVDILFGGPGRFRMKIEGRDFTAIEYRIIRRLLEMFFKDLEKSWSMLEDVSFVYQRSELNPQFANIVAPTDIVLASIFEVELEWDRSFMGYCIPYASVEPIKDRLYGRFQSEFIEVNQAWRKRIEQHVNTINLNIIAELATTEVPLRDLLWLKEGDILPLNVGPNDPLKFKIQDVEKGLCSAGQRNGSYAVELISIDNPLMQETNVGLPNESKRIEGGIFPGDSKPGA